ncbi:homoserine dehydrogenase [Candidatus Microgenomates bacterium]|nr:MAG: homoserine dehydrogenase [Candidatus Microgenomates bacterium]
MRKAPREKIKIGVLGAGTVGSSVLEHYFKKKPGWENIDLVNVVVKDPIKKRAISIPQSIISTNLNKTLTDPSIKIIVSLLGDEKAEYKSILAALKNKKFVVTANKVVIAIHGFELFEVAKDNNVGLFFEAAVGGGIQIIDNLLERYTPNNFSSILGILNGTTNYILTKMSHDKVVFEEALKNAKSHGYAEPNPKNDIEGFDSAYKLAILASLTFRKGWINPKNIYIEGITKITDNDFKYAKHLGFAIKLVASAVNTNGNIEAWVAPAMIPKNHLLADVNGVQNAILLKGDSIGETKLQGQGAGGNPTSASIWSDILKACHYIKNNVLPVYIDLKNEIKITNFNKYNHRNYIRITVKDQPGVIGIIGNIFGINKVNINQIIQLDKEKTDLKEKKWAEIAIDLNSSKEENVIKALNQIKKASICKKVCSRIRIIN